MNSDQNSELSKFIHKSLETSIEAQAFKSDFRVYDQALKMIEYIRNGNTDDWNKFVNGEDMKIWYKQEEGKNLYSVYCEKFIDAPIQNFLAILAEAQIFKDWVPLTYKSDILYETSHFRKAGEFAVKLPWPFQNRSVYIAVSAMPVENERSMIVTMKSIDGETWLNKFEIKKDEATVPVDVYFCSGFIESLGENRQKLRFMFNADPKLALPQWLIN